MKYLGIDYGTKRVGIAISDPDGSFAFPKAVFDTGRALQDIALLCTHEKIDALVIGDSVASNEKENKVNEKIKKFADELRIRTGLPISFEREDFSSVEAYRYQSATEKRDDSAAAIILQRFLDKNKPEDKTIS